VSVDAARQLLFGDALASDDARPVAVLAPVVDEGARHAMLLRAEALMRALAVLEDSRADEADERNPVDQSVRRLEAKVDLLVSLVGSLLQRDRPADPLRALQWSARGTALDLPADACPAPGAAVVLRLQPSDALPEAIQLPSRVLAVEPAGTGRRVWLAFDPLPAPLEALLERHLFRVHRRAVAEARRPR
jgi:hypothetical protein